MGGGGFKGLNHQKKKINTIFSLFSSELIPHFNHFNLVPKMYIIHFRPSPRVRKINEKNRHGRRVGGGRNIQLLMGGGVKRRESPK